MDGFKFTGDEWQSVRIAPWIVGTAVIESDGGSPFSVLREIGAVDKQIDQAYRSTEHRNLVKTIAHDLRDAPASDPLVEPERLADWHDQLKDVLEIVDAKAPGADNRDFREWLYEIATDTADAARDHWRIRGPRVSEEEQDLLDRLATMLDVG
jgi:phenylpropionate dioxygenase-like ring-hydroxylating dioxygenase large terminal subunit